MTSERREKGGGVSAEVDGGTVVAPSTGDGATPDSQPPRARPRMLAGRYRLGRRIGKGGMGEVIAAHDEQVGRDVAIKQMRAAAPTEQAIRRFLREASIQGRLEHPAIVPVHELGRDDDGLPFFVMKKLSGITLGKILVDPATRDRIGQQQILRAFVDVCLAIELAHVRGIVHRDLKPDNILLGDFGEVYILDWGVAKIIGEDDDGEFADLHSGDHHATRAGTAIGTPGYMAPEQARGVPDIDGRADIYALGCVLFEILTGAPLHPRVGETTSHTTAEQDPPPQQRTTGRHMPPELDALCAAATAVERAERLTTARELGDRVQRVLDGDRDLARRRDLARDHLARAQAAFGGGDAEDLRRTAMREAAAALALDPALDGAAALVGRLMLDPPRTTPREVDEAIAADEIRTAQADARAGIWGLIACFAFTPLLWWIAPPGAHALATFLVVLVLEMAIYLVAYHGSRPRPGLVILGNVVMIATVARMFSPILVAPGVAAVLALAMVVTPRLSVLGSAPSIGALFISGAIVPLILERIGVLSPTISIDAAGIHLHTPAIGSAEGPALLVAALYTAGLIIGTCWMAHSMRTRTRAAHRALHLQAWQLRQLVPR
ncbi:MAG TPA: serine/threonine-protein kinase [Kofleriaceae bacterium]|nr:serine/threonine-protein kinase [Kofleriaceae bacterium]